MTKEDIQSHFKEGPGNITEVKLMNGFGFIEYDDPMDARDVVPGKLHMYLNGQRQTSANFESAFRTSQPSMRQLQATFLTKCTSDGSDLNGSRLTVQFARGSRQREPFAQPDRTHPRPRRTAYRMQITGLPGETSWQVS